jgi:hypothetical protein
MPLAAYDCGKASWMRRAVRRADKIALAKGVGCGTADLPGSQRGGRPHQRVRDRCGHVPNACMHGGYVGVTRLVAPTRGAWSRRSAMPPRTPYFATAQVRCPDRSPRPSLASASLCLKLLTGVAAIRRSAYFPARKARSIQAIFSCCSMSPVRKSLVPASWYSSAQVSRSTRRWQMSAS